METLEIVAIKKVLQDKQYVNRELYILRDLYHPNIIYLKHYFFTNSDKDVGHYHYNLIIVSINISKFSDKLLSRKLIKSHEFFCKTKETHSYSTC